MKRLVTIVAALTIAISYQVHTFAYLKLGTRVGTRTVTLKCRRCPFGISLPIAAPRE